MVVLQDMSVSQLMSMVDSYPWFAPARAALCRKVMESNGPDAADSVLRDAVAYLPELSYVRESMISTGGSAFADPDLAAEPVAAEQPKPRIIMAGMDYFSRDDYADVRRDDDARFGSLAVVDYSLPAPETTRQEETDMYDIVSETLAEIYAENDHPEMAIEIYRKLSLVNPEKSAYFATLIDNLKS